MRTTIFSFDNDEYFIWGSEPVKKLKAPRIIEEKAEEIKALLNPHGCTIEDHEDHCFFLFPEDTVRVRGLTLGVSECYKVKFPDGFVLNELYDICRRISFFSVAKEEAA
jgi:hypothetical protein